jgi:hypothetical protein
MERLSIHSFSNTQGPSILTNQEESRSQLHSVDHQLTQAAVAFVAEAGFPVARVAAELEAVQAVAQAY